MRHYLDLFSETAEVILVPRKNTEDDAVVIMSLSGYNAIKETEYLLSNRANRNRLEQSIKEFESDETVRFEENIYTKRGLVLGKL